VLKQLFELSVRYATQPIRRIKQGMMFYPPFLSSLYSLMLDLHPWVA